MAESKYASTPEETSNLPKGIKYIIGNEAAERFSYYGMKAILVVFMTKYLHWMIAGVEGPAMSNAQSNEYYHFFVSATYIFPIIGSLLADIYLGKYRTILYLSVVYCLGHLALAFVGTPGLSPTWWLVIGLSLIAFGSGGIKPCVSAHVGDQFGTKNSHLMTKVFQWFYFAINFGSTASTMLTPILLKWYGPHIAFGVPGVLMALATIMFWMGRNVFIHVPPAGSMSKFLQQTFSKDGITALLKLSLIYAFVAVFWGLFDQTGSSWVLQAKNMDRTFLGVEWLESQIQAVNPILVMILIPLFQFFIYPSVNKVFKLTPIRKISIGFFLTAGSFYTVTVAQQLIDQGQTPSIAWQLWAYVLLTAGEVMISITGLEFSYTQAPKSMKSVVMAVWLASVSLGNVYTAYFNHSIQVPGVNQVVAEKLKEGGGSTHDFQFKTTFRDIAGSDRKGKSVQISGADEKFDTADDVFLELDGFNKLSGVTCADNDTLEFAAGLIDDAFYRSDGEQSLPSEEDGNALLRDLTDSKGKTPVYKLLSKNDYRITSPQGDGSEPTQWDGVLKGSVSRVNLTLDDKVDAPHDWLEQQMIDTLGDEGLKRVEKARGDIPETTIDHDITVGGQDTKEGAEYFMFWTMVILYTAILFVPVGYFYKEKSYIQTEQEQ